METHVHHSEHRYLRVPPTTRRRSTGLTPAEWIETGIGAGLVGGLVMTLPLLLWDWARSSHIALELPTATSSWLFGLQHFSHSFTAFGLGVGACYAFLRPSASSPDDDG